MSIYNKHLHKTVNTLLAAVFLLFGAAANADERILDFHSDISISEDGSITVTETIRVRSEGENMRRGIYRDFPTRYKDRLGNNFRVSFDVLDVQRDGKEESFHTEDRSNGVRVYIGSAQRLLAPGEHEYRLRYHTNRQLGYFADYDELYWNVTGLGWMFPIDHASARVVLPQAVAADQLRIAFYTGSKGSSDTNAESRITSGTTIEFQTTTGLQPRQGLTIAVGWPKGITHEPATSVRLGYFFKDNGRALAVLIGLLAPLFWYLWAWKHYGRDPRKGIIIPLFKPPKGLTPAGCRYIQKMSFDNKAFTAAVISLAIKGYLKIYDESDTFILRRMESNNAKSASTGEQAVLTELFADGVTTVELDNENHAVFGKARKGLNKALKTEHLGRVFNLNSIYALPAVLLSVIALVVAVKLTGSVMILIIFVILSMFMHVLFLFLLRAPTPGGRRIMDEIEGFKMYLDTAEQDRLDRMRSPELTPEVFELFLPYAFALGVENNWCERFSREFPEPVDGSKGYHAGWYSGQYAGLAGLHHLGSDFSNSFSSAISSASTPPGSSSGSGGGGFSGGGGGGGGGGGW